MKLATNRQQSRYHVESRHSTGGKSTALVLGSTHQLGERARAGKRCRLSTLRLTQANR